MFYDIPRLAFCLFILHYLFKVKKVYYIFEISTGISIRKKLVTFVFFDTVNRQHANFIVSFSKRQTVTDLLNHYLDHSVIFILDGLMHVTKGRQGRWRGSGGGGGVVEKHHMCYISILFSCFQWYVKF